MSYYLFIPNMDPLADNDFLLQIHLQTTGGERPGGREGGELFWSDWCVLMSQEEDEWSRAGWGLTGRLQLQQGSLRTAGRHWAAGSSRVWSNVTSYIGWYSHSNSSTLHTRLRLITPADCPRPAPLSLTVEFSELCLWDSEHCFQVNSYFEVKLVRR